MKTNSINPTSEIYPATVDYIHALEVIEPKRFLFVSGTMGLDKNGLAAKTLEEQLHLVWSNIGTILSSADMSMDNVVRVTSYLRDPSFAEENQNARVEALQGRLVPTTTIVAQTLVSEWMIETEVIACA